MHSAIPIKQQLYVALDVLLCTLHFPEEIDIRRRK